MIEILQNAYVSAALRAIIVFAVILQIIPLLIYLERRICAFIQDRIGPNRVGPAGLLQPLADVVKLLLKEDIYPSGVDRFFYTLAPLLTYIPPVLAFAAIPAVSRKITANPGPAGMSDVSQARRIAAIASTPRMAKLIAKPVKGPSMKLPKTTGAVAAAHTPSNVRSRVR